MLKALIHVFVRTRHETEEVDGNQERPLPQRWRDPAPKPERHRFGFRAE